MLTRSSQLPLRYATPAAWQAMAVEQFDEVLQDHAHCERKAAASAVSLLTVYPDRVELARRMSKLAAEELRHFREVYDIIVARGLTLRNDTGDDYAKALIKHMRPHRTERLVDRLLVAALIEARSCERLELLAAGLTEPKLAQFYQALATAESGHYRLFVELARTYGEEDVDQRFDAWLDTEAEIAQAMPLAPRIH